MLIIRRRTAVSDPVRLFEEGVNVVPGNVRTGIGDNESISIFIVARRSFINWPLTSGDEIAAVKNGLLSSLAVSFLYE